MALLMHVSKDVSTAFAHSTLCPAELTCMLCAAVLEGQSQWSCRGQPSFAPLPSQIFGAAAAAAVSPLQVKHKSHCSLSRPHDRCTQGPQHHGCMSFWAACSTFLPGRVWFEQHCCTAATSTHVQLCSLHLASPCTIPCKIFHHAMPTYSGQHVSNACADKWCL